MTDDDLLAATKRLDRDQWLTALLVRLGDAGPLCPGGLLGRMLDGCQPLPEWQVSGGAAREMYLHGLEKFGLCRARPGGWWELTARGKILVEELLRCVGE